MTITFTITNRKGMTFCASIDEIDADLLQHKWGVWDVDFSRTTYVKRAIKRRTVTLHRTVLERMLGRSLAPDERADHRDGDGLNNTRANLRVASTTQNRANSVVNNTNQLGIKGVRRHGNKYIARFKAEYLGLFLTAELAHAAYMEAAKKEYGEFANGGVHVGRGDPATLYPQPLPRRNTRQQVHRTQSGKSVLVRNLGSSAVVDARKATPELTPEQTALVQRWINQQLAMNEAAAQGKFAFADGCLTVMREIEAELGFRPATAPTTGRALPESEVTR